MRSVWKGSYRFEVEEILANHLANLLPGRVQCAESTASGSGSASSPFFSPSVVDSPLESALIFSPLGVGKVHSCSLSSPLLEVVA